MKKISKILAGFAALAALALTSCGSKTTGTKVVKPISGGENGTTFWNSESFDGCDMQLWGYEESNARVSFDNNNGQFVEESGGWYVAVFLGGTYTIDTSEVAKVSFKYKADEAFSGDVYVIPLATTNGDSTKVTLDFTEEEQTYEADVTGSAEENYMFEIGGTGSNGHTYYIYNITFYDEDDNVIKVSAN